MVERLAYRAPLARLGAGLSAVPALHAWRADCRMGCRPGRAEMRELASAGLLIHKLVLEDV